MDTREGSAEKKGLVAGRISRGRAVGAFQGGAANPPTPLPPPTPKALNENPRLWRGGFTAMVSLPCAPASSHVWGSQFLEYREEQSQPGCEV